MIRDELLKAFRTAAILPENRTLDKMTYIGAIELVSCKWEIYKDKEDGYWMRGDWK